MTYGFVNGKGITPYFGIESEWGSADLAADMEYIKDGQLSSVFSWERKEVEGQMLVLAAQLYLISIEQSIEAHCTYSIDLASICCLSITVDQGPATSVSYCNFTIENVIVTALNFVLHFCCFCRTESSVLSFGQALTCTYTPSDSPRVLF